MFSLRGGSNMLRLGNFARFILLYVLSTFNPIIMLIVQSNAKTLGLVESMSPTAQKLLLSLLPVYAFVTFILVCLIAAGRHGFLREKYPSIKIHEFLDAFLFSQLAYVFFLVFLYRWIEGQDAFEADVYFFIAYIPLSLICIPLSHIMFNRILRVIQQKKRSIGTDDKILFDFSIFVVIIFIFAASSLWKELPYTKYSKYLPPRHGSPQEALSQIAYALKTQDTELLSKYVDVSKIMKQPDDEQIAYTILQDIQNGKFVVDNEASHRRITYKEYVMFWDEYDIYRRSSEIYSDVKVYVMPRHKPLYGKIQMIRVNDHFEVVECADLRTAILNYRSHMADLAQNFPNFESIAPKSKDYLDFRVVSWFVVDDKFRATKELRAKVFLTNKTNRDIKGVRFMGLIREAGDNNAIWDFSMYGRLEPSLSPGQSREIVCIESSRDNEELPPNLGGEFEYRLVPYEFNFEDNSSEDLRIKR